MNILASSELTRALGRALDSTYDHYRWELDVIEDKALQILTRFVEELGRELS